MNDLKADSFGLTIAYLLPGVVAIFGIAQWSQRARAAIDVFSSAEANIGYFLLFVLVALFLGLQVSLGRALIYEHLLRRGSRLGLDAYAALGSKDKLDAFRAAIDEQYRYYQFWGGISIVLPVAFIGWVRGAAVHLGVDRTFFVIVAFTVVELANVWATLGAYDAFISGAREFLVPKAKPEARRKIWVRKRFVRQGTKKREE